MNAPLLPDTSLRHDLAREDMASKLRSLAIARPQAPQDFGRPTSRSARRRSRRLYIAVAVAILLLPALWALDTDLRPALSRLLATTTRDARQDTVRLPPPASVAPAPDRASTVIGSGTVVARRRVVLRPEISGRIAEIDVEAGDRVVAGQRIARLDSRLAEADAALALSKAAAAETNVRIADIDLRDARHPLARLQALARQNFASAADLTAAGLKVERLEAALAGARQALTAARIEVDRAQAVLARYEVRAPFGGVVAARFADVGDMASAGTEGGPREQGVAVLLDPDALTIDVDVAETGIGRISPGQSATAVLDAYPDRPFALRVATIVPEASHEKGTVAIRLDFPPGLASRPPGILPGMAAKVTFAAAAAEATAKPTSEKE